MVDALATLASLIKVSKQEDIKPIQMSIDETPAHCYSIKEEENDDHPWYQDILRYVKNREYLDQKTENDKRILRRLASDYVLDGEILCKKGKDQSTTSESSLFDHLINIWEFIPGPVPGTCSLYFLVDFKFQSPLHRQPLE
ncbi:uncharacterized protein [Gossypium hirsutum]|uniref:Uncharacterized protein n=1 Tax=Gossypium hirsutum TaxID=3635 RepID=A0A1U8KWX5_GOSHI|nr:uncharacterized protein LOC107921565 [Gossypium hirsutum]